MKPHPEPFRKLQTQHGIAMVEFALTVLITFLFLVAGLDVIRFGYVSATTQHVLTRAARDAIVATTADNVSSAKTPEERANDIVTNIYAIGEQFALDLSDSTITICPLDSSTDPSLPPSCSPNNAGSSRDFIKIRLLRPFRFFWGGWVYPLDRTVVAKNEPF